jgi:hypothetical protein
VFSQAHIGEYDFAASQQAHCQKEDWVRDEIDARLILTFYLTK